MQFTGRTFHIAQSLIHHEGLRLHPYRCPAGKLTIGVGRNLEDPGLSSAEIEYLGLDGSRKIKDGITEEEAMYLLEHDIQRVIKELQSAFIWFGDLSAPRQVALIDMAFNLGFPRFCGFKRMLAALTRGNYETAAAEMLDSKWRRDVGQRVEDLARMVREGRYLSWN